MSNWKPFLASCTAIIAVGAVSIGAHIWIAHLDNAELGRRMTENTRAVERKTDSDHALMDVLDPAPVPGPRQSHAFGRIEK